MDMVAILDLDWHYRTAMLTLRCVGDPWTHADCSVLSLTRLTIHNEIVSDQFGQFTCSLRTVSGVLQLALRTVRIGSSSRNDS
jgi:hypothetical protein